VRLAVARLAAGDLPGARAAAAAAEAPAAALAGVLCDLAEARDSDVEVDLEPEEAERALRGMAAALAASARPEVLARLRAAAPALAGPFPWLAAALGAAGGAPGPDAPPSGPGGAAPPAAEGPGGAAPAAPGAPRR
jgi:hypothetical protein